MKTLKIDANKALELYPKASIEMKEIFHSTFGEDYFKSKSLFETITCYKDVCKALNQKEVTKDDFSEEFDSNTVEKLIAFAQIKQIEELFNGNWVKDWSDRNQRKWYPYFEYKNGGWVLRGCRCDYWCGCGPFGFYKDEQTANFVGKTFINIYSKNNVN